MTRQERFRLTFRLYCEVFAAVGHDHSATARVFDALAAVARKQAPRRRKGKHNPEFDRLLLAAYDAAPKGQQEKAVGQVRRGRSHETVMRRLRRLLSERRERDAEATALGDAMAECLAQGDRQGARDVFVDHLERQSGRPLPAAYRSEGNLTADEIRDILFDRHPVAVTAPAPVQGDK